MTARTSNCPNCGAAIEFMWSAAVQTTCAFCRSILVRHDVDLEKVGVVGDLPADASPIQRGTAGRWKNRSFTVVGRIIYQYGRGSWNEWHLRFADGESGWLSDAQLEYAITVQVPVAGTLPTPGDVEVGIVIRYEEQRLAVTSVTVASYRGVEGELPFEYWDKTEVRFVDLADGSGTFGTIDYSEDPPLLFIGEHVTFAELALSDVRSYEGWPVPS